MPYGISKSKGGESAANVAKMESCVMQVMGKNGALSKDSAVAICKSAVFDEPVKLTATEKVIAASCKKQFAEWTSKQVNDLPDSSFAFIGAGGKKDADGKTAPRALRKLPYKGADGKVDLPHLRNALARLSQSDIPAASRAAVQKKLESAAKTAGVGNYTEKLNALLLFADDMQIDQEVANKIIARLYAFGLDATELDEAIDNLKDIFSRDAFTNFLNDMTDAQIDEAVQSVVDDENLEKIGEMQAEVEQAKQGATINCPQGMSEFFFSDLGEMDLSKVKAGETSDIQIMRVGSWNHPSYGKVNITPNDLKQFEENFKNGVRKIDLAVDINHDNDHKAVGWFRDLKRVGDALFATIEWTMEGAKLVSEKAFRYFSPELSPQYKDDETGKNFRNVLLGGALTNRPFFKAMQPLMASEETAIDSFSNLFFINPPMNKLIKLLEATENRVATSAERTQIAQAYNSLDTGMRTPEMKSVLTKVGLKFDETGVASEVVETEEEVKAKAAAEAEEAKKAEDEAKAQAAADEDAAAVAAKADEEKSKDEKVIEAKEKTFSIKASELKALQTAASQLSRLMKVQSSSKSVESLMFSEKSKSGIIMPASKDAVVNFAASLSEDQANKFFEILGSLQGGIAKQFEEIGKDAPHAVQNFTDSKAYLTGKMGYSETQANEIVAQMTKEQA